MKPGDLFIFAIVLAAIILSACSPPAAGAPWTIVCDANGRYNYTWDNGEVNPYVEPFASSQQAARDMEKAKWVAAHRNALGSRYSTAGYKPCPDQ
jgi:hypothetical protein